MEILLQGQRRKPEAALGGGAGRRAGRQPRGAGARPPRRGSRPTPTPHQPWDVKGYKMPGGTPSTPRSRRSAVVPGEPAQAAQGCADAGAAGHPGRGGRGRAGRLRHRAAHRDPLLRRAGHRPGQQEHDPGVLLRPAGDHHGRRSAPRASARTRRQQDRRARRGHDGRRYRLRLGQGRHRRRAQGRHASRRRRRARPTREKLLDKAVERGQDHRGKPPTRCWPGSPPTADPADAKGVDFVIEAVFEDPKLKHKVFAGDRGRSSRRTRCSARTPRRCRSPGSPTA